MGLAPRAHYDLTDGTHFPTPHDADEFVADLQRTGQIKRCAHVKVKPRYQRDARYYRPVCEEDCFRQEQIGSYPAAERTRFYGCPADCRRYVPRWKGRLRTWAWWQYQRTRADVIGIARWYASLSTPTQALFAAAILALIGMPWRGAIIEGLKLLLGK